MRILTPILAAVALLAACSKPAPPPAAQPKPAAPVLSFDGFGPVRFGARLADIEQQLGAKAEPLGENDPACSSVRLKSLPGARLMVENGVVTRADADAGTANSLGLAVGDSLTAAKESIRPLRSGRTNIYPRAIT
jgi:hypothetical protein